MRHPRPVEQLKCRLCKKPIEVGDVGVAVTFGQFSITPNRLLIDQGMTLRVRRWYHADCAEAAGVSLEDLP